MSSAVLRAALAVLLFAAAPASALDLFARHEVTVHFATPDGKPMANAEVRVFAPGKTGAPTLTGHTDDAGKFEFPANEDGFWRAVAHSGGEIASISVRVGGQLGTAQNETLSPWWLVGGLLLLLVLAFAFRVARIRARQRPSQGR